MKIQNEIARLMNSGYYYVNKQGSPHELRGSRYCRMEATRSKLVVTVTLAARINLK